MIFATDILRAAAVAGDITVEELTGPSRAHEHSCPRHVAIVLLRDRCGCSFARIARLLGNRHFATVEEAYRRTLPRVKQPGPHMTVMERTEALLEKEAA